MADKPRPVEDERTRNLEACENIIAAIEGAEAAYRVGDVQRGDTWLTGAAARITEHVRGEAV